MAGVLPSDGRPRGSTMPRPAPAARKVDRPSNRVEIMIGRSLAACVHPYAAWRVSSRSGRLTILIGYTVIGYVAVLGALLIHS